MAARSSTGGGYEARGRYYARVTIATGKRETVSLPWATGLPEAQERGRALQVLVNMLRSAGKETFIGKVLELGGPADAARLLELQDTVRALVGGEMVPVAPVKAPSARGLTFRDVGELWTSGELARRFSDDVDPKAASVEDDRCRLEKHCYPVVGDVPVASFTRDHARAVLAALPRKLSRGTRRHVAQLVARVMRLSVWPLDIIKASPIPPGFVPKAGKRKAFQSLYVDEEAKLIACARIPLERRFFYAFSCRNGMRASEVLRVRWADIDLEHSTIKVDRNKTNLPSKWTLDADVLAALRIWKATQPRTEPNDPVFGYVGNAKKLAANFRSDLRLAGVARPELFERTDERSPIRVHDTRSSFIVVASSVGRNERWVMTRTAHTSSAMMSRYMREGEQLATPRWFEPMHLAIPELAAVSAAAEVAATPPQPEETEPCDLEAAAENKAVGAPVESVKSPSMVTDLDYATYELTTAIQAGLVARTGKRAYLVAAKASRTFIDFNRTATAAYEVPRAAPVYDAYHAALARAVAAVKAQAPAAALVVDVHGQSADVTAVLRGTQDGQTATLATLHATPKGFLTVLLGSGVKVSPAATAGPENPDFNGGYIVGSQGLVGSGKVNAVQLEFGLDYRDTPALVKSTADKVAAALVAHLEMTGAL